MQTFAEHRQHYIFVFLLYCRASTPILVAISPYHSRMACHCSFPGTGLNPKACLRQALYRIWENMVKQMGLQVISTLKKKRESQQAP